MRSLIARAIGIVTFLFAAFGGYLRTIAPPEEANSRSAVGFASILCLCLLLLITGLLQWRLVKHYKQGFLFGAAILFVLAVVSGLVYKYNYDRLVFAYPPEEKTPSRIAGLSLSGEAEKKKDGRSNSQLVADFGGLPNIELVWSDESIRRAKLLLIVNYVAFVLCVAGIVFGLSEGLLAPSQPDAAQPTTRV